MADVMVFKDGRTEVIFDGRDFVDVAERYMGYEAAEYVRSLSDEYECLSAEYEELVSDTEKDMDEMREARHELLRSVREIAEELLDLLAAPRLDRKKVSRAAGEIYKLANDEL